jgi:phage shock protein PspC (stress-responsive transcriptional regulator)
VIYPMCRAGPRSHARAMNTNTVNPEDTTNEAGPPAQPPFQPGNPGPERILLRRSYTDHMLAGVAGGLARYFGVDATIVRIAFVVLTLFGGAGIPLYLAGLLLIPEEGSDQSIAGSLTESLQYRSR